VTLVLNEIHLIERLKRTFLIAAADRRLTKPDGSSVQNEGPVDGKESEFDNRLVGEDSWPTSFRCGPQEAQMPSDRRPIAPAFRRPR
jgi:hypothetical protein